MTPSGILGILDAVEYGQANVLRSSLAWCDAPDHLSTVCNSLRECREVLNQIRLVFGWTHESPTCSVWNVPFFPVRPWQMTFVVASVQH